jgi:hypothetical protein
MEDLVTPESVENLRHVMEGIGRSSLIARFHKSGSKRYYDCRSVSWRDAQHRAIVLSEYDVTHVLQARGNAEDFFMDDNL